jgi:Domain of unknown function (DUF4410)
MYKNTRIVCVLAIFGAAALLGGCATSVPKAQYNKALPTQYHVDGDDKIQVRVDAAAGVAATDFEKQQLASMVTSKLEERRVKNPSNGDVRDCSVVITITRFDKGNAVARLMLAGLGQIHLDGLIEVYAQPSNEKIDDFTVSKTFAWGGIYGVATKIEDVEPAFADAVSAALTGQEEVSASATKGK